MLDEVVQAGERPFGGFEEDLSGLALEGLVVVATLGRRQILPRLPRCEAASVVTLAVCDVELGSFRDGNVTKAQSGQTTRFWSLR